MPTAHLSSPPQPARGQFHVLVDLNAGSVGKGAISPRLVEILGLNSTSCHNGANAGHSVVIDGVKFVSKVVPTPMILHGVRGRNITGYLSPGCAFSPLQLLREWEECGRPHIVVHDRATLVLPEHAAQERMGPLSTKHLGSTMQGTGAAVVAKVMRVPGTALASDLPEVLGRMIGTSPPGTDRARLDRSASEMLDTIAIVDGPLFRDLTHEALGRHGILHEGSQGYALSLNHGLPWPHTTSRDCDTMTAMSYMAVPPQQAGQIWGCLRAGHMIRVGNVVEDGVEVGNSGSGYPDQHEISWADIASSAGMPEEEARMLTERELTTVTKRVRKVFTESRIGLDDAIRTCGVTHLAVNFVNYLSWSDHKVRKMSNLSAKTRAYVDGLENRYQIPVGMIGTGADHADFVYTL